MYARTKTITLTTIMDLPQELHELIIDELQNAFLELKACSLVCKSWLPRCRLHLFRIVRIRPRRVYGIAKEQMLAHTDRFQASFVGTFGNSEINSCIRGVFLDSTIRVSRPAIPHELRIVSPKGRVDFTPLISSTLFPFRNLRLLRLNWKFITIPLPSNHNMDPDIDISLFEQLLDRINLLEHLVIEKYQRFHSKRDILRCIAVHAPRLKTLSLSQFEWYPSFGALVLEDIFDEWNLDFVAQGVPPLRLERLSLRKFSSKGTDLIQQVVLPSPCLNLCSLRYLAISATSIQTALADERFLELGKKIVHLTINTLNTSVLKLGSFPKLSQLQLFVIDESLLLQLLQDILSQCPLEVPFLELHINFERDAYGDLIRQIAPCIAPLEHTHTSSVDPVLNTLINKMSSRAERIEYVSMDFVHVDGPEMQQRCIGKVFPLSFATGSLRWRHRKSLEWWFE